MIHSLRLAALAALLLSARAFAWNEPDCQTVVWSNEHGHYHCVDYRRYDNVRYYDPRPVSGPIVYLDLSFNRYRGPWRYRGWYAAPGFYGYAAPRFYGPVSYGPVFYAPPRYVRGPYYGPRYFRY